MSLQLENIIQKFGHLITASSVPAEMLLQKLSAELCLWKMEWKQHLIEKQETPCNIETIMNKCNEDVYTNIHSLLSILAVLPVSVACVERTFSALRRLKTWLRSNMRQERLVGLAMLHIHYNIEVDVHKIIDEFALKRRRLDFVI